MKNCRVLVIEDELLIGLDVVWILENAGFGHVVHAMSETEALHQIHSHSWNVVVADANLNGCSIEQVARLMIEKELPFMVVTGYERHSLPEIIGEAPVLDKPYSHHELIRIVQQLCRTAASRFLSSPRLA